ncbi:hypothetical protein Tco_0722217 [Tanacetum coccineum]
MSMTKMSNILFKPIEWIGDHITDNGWDPLYTVWDKQGELALPTPPLQANYATPLMSLETTTKDLIWPCHWKVYEPGKMQHPVDGGAWKKFDMKYPDFAKEPRNVRLGLCADGFNPFGNLSQTYNMWPVILTTYNLPPWLCMKESNFMLTLLIPGPKSPGKDIDVYLRPLIEDLQVLWDKKGVETTDIVSGQNFNMRAMVLWTINDFPARSSLSGWSGQGYKACPTCNEETPSIGVKNKIAYVGHRRFLRKPHKWRSSREFNGDTDHRDPPKEYPRDVILAQHARLLTRVPGKHPKHGGVKIKRNVEVELNWTKRNKAKPEGSIAEGYVAEEALTLSSHYFRDVTTKFNRLERNVDPPPPTCQFQAFRSVCNTIGLRSFPPFGAKEFNKARWYVLHNSPEIDTYRAQFQSLFPEKKHARRIHQLICERHANNLQDPEVSTTSELFALANGPSRTPMSVTLGCRWCEDVGSAAMNVAQLKTTAFVTPGPDGEMFMMENSGDSDVEDLINDDDGVEKMADVARAHGGDGGGEDPSRPPPTSFGCAGCFINRGKGNAESRQEDGKRTPEQVLKECGWPLIKAGPSRSGNLKREHWIRDPETGAYDLDRIRRGKPDEYTDDEWEKYINFWNDPANAQRAETNRLNRSKSTVVSRHGSRSIPLTRHLMKMTSATQEEPSEIDTFYRSPLELTVLYSKICGSPNVCKMRELEATGEHTTTEINAMVRGGKLRGHIPNVGPVMPGYVRSRLSYTAPVDRSRDVDFMMSLMRSDNRFADAFARYDSGGASGSRAHDSEGGEDGDDTGGEDGGDDTS